MKARVYLSLLFCVLFAFALTFTVSATSENAITFTMEPSGSFVQAGETFTVDIVIPENTGFAWAKISVTYEDDQIEFLKDSNYASDVFGVNTIAKTMSVNHREAVNDILISVGAENAVSNPENGVVYDQTGLLITLTFRVLEGYEGDVDLKITYNQKNIISNADEKDYVVTVNNPTIKAVDCSAGHTPGEEATCTTDQVCVKCQTVLVEAFGHNIVDGVCTVCGERFYTLGDVNNDGFIDTTDAKLIMQLDLGLVAEDEMIMEAADVNGDNVVDTTDAKLIMQLDLGLIEEF